MTYVQCATEGTFQTCSEDNTNGDNGVCFVEYREQNQKLTQLCTGCKDAKDWLKRLNMFNDIRPKVFHVGSLILNKILSLTCLEMPLHST